jgi:hypothetical protein
VIAVIVTFCLAVVLFAAIPTWSSPGVQDYNPWYDVNDDGSIDGSDLIVLCRAFGTTGQNITKGSIQYDSGWINITDKCGENITVTHNLNIADWNDPNITVDITGKTTPGGGLQRFLGLTGQQGWNKTYGGTGLDEAQALVQTSDGGYALAGYTDSFGAGNNDAWLVKTDSTGNMQWNKTYGGTGFDYVNALVQTSDGGYALAGETWSFGAGFYDSWLIKTDAESGLAWTDSSANMPRWSRTYGGTDNDEPRSIIQTSDGGYALAGFTFPGASNADFWLVKTDASGNALWNKTYGGTGDDTAYSVVQTGDGGYALAGYTYSFGAGGNDFWLVKTDASGNQQWNKTYGGTSDDWAYSVIQTGDQGYALAGVTYGFGPWDSWLVKTDSSGNQQWNKTYGGTSQDWALSVVQTGDGGYALAGYTYSFGAGGNDFWLVKTDASGNQQWNKTYGGTSDDWAYSVIQTGDQGYALAGVTYGFGPWDSWLVKTDSSGNQQWNKTYGGTSQDWALSVVQTGDGGYALAGYTYSFGAGGNDFWLVKTDASGNQQWNKTYGGTSNDAAYSIVKTGDGGYALAGSTYSYGAGGYDFWLVKTDSAGLAWPESSPNTITLHRGATDAYWNFVRVQIWQRK